MAVLHYSFHSHPKITGLSKAAVGVYALALSYASANLTDGFVPDNYVRSLDPNHRSLTKRSPFARLIAAGLVAKSEGGYTLLDYLDYNPTKAVVEQKRREARERMNRVRTNKPPKEEPGSREQAEDVTANVRDIGTDKPLLHQESATSRAENVEERRQESPPVFVDGTGWESIQDELGEFRKRRTG